MKPTIVTLVLATQSLAVCAQQTFPPNKPEMRSVLTEPPSAPVVSAPAPPVAIGGLGPGFKTSIEAQQAEVLTAYASEHDGFRFRAYHVKWQKQDVIVSDPMGRSDFKKGDTITFTVNTMELPVPGGTQKLVQFQIVDQAGFAAPQPFDAGLGEPVIGVPSR